MKHTHVNNIKEYAVAAERALIDIKRVTMMYRVNPNELTRYDLQQLVGELYTKTCALHTCLRTLHAKTVHCTGLTNTSQRTLLTLQSQRNLRLTLNNL